MNSLENLKKKSFAGVRWTAVSNGMLAFLQIGQMIILARFLSPLEYGTWGIINVVIGFSYAFLDMGISNAIIHFQKIEHDELRTLFWFNVMAGVFVSIGVFLLAPWLAASFNAPSLVDLLILLAPVFFFISLGQQARILLEKELEFQKVSVIEIVSRSLGFALMLILLFSGLKVSAVVWGAVISAAFSSCLFISKVHFAQQPFFVFRVKKIKKYLQFGAFQMMERTLNYFNTQIDSLLIGRILGLEVLGFYTLAKDLVLRPIYLINPVITRVTFPMMSKIQDDPVLLRKTYLKTLEYLSFFNFALYSFIGFFAAPVVTVFFGVQWSHAILPLQILSLWAAIRSTGNPVGSLLLAKGRADLAFYWNAWLFIIIPGVIYLSSGFGINWVCSALTIAQLALVVPCWHFLVYPLCQAAGSEYAWAIGRPLILSIIAALGTLLAAITVGLSGATLLVVGIIIYILCYFLLIKHYSKDFIDVVYQQLWRPCFGEKRSAAIIHAGSNSGTGL